MTKEKEYTPNFNDPRTITRCKDALAFVCAYVSAEKDTPLSKMLMIEYFGQPQHKLAAYIKDTLLICTNHYYSIDNKISKKYIMNIYGVNFLTSKVYKENSDSISTNVVQYEPSLEESIALIEKKYEKQLRDLDNGTIQYTVKSDRYFVSLQNIRREVKKQVLAKHHFVHQYDIECCAPTLLYQFAQMNGLDEYLHGICNYLKNRTAWREEISRVSGLEVYQVKKIITSLFSGAILGANPQWDIFVSIGCNYEIMHILQNNQMIKELKSDISKMWSVLSKTVMSRTMTHNEVTGKSRLNKVTSKQKWNLYFRLERQVLDSVNGYLKLTNNKAFLEHDGWGTIDCIDQDLLKEHVRIKTGFKISLDYELVKLKEHPESVKTTTAAKANSGSHLSVSLADKSVLEYIDNQKDILCVDQNLSHTNTSFMKLIHMNIPQVSILRQ